ncbi:hypothetical protein FWH30_03610, partial [Microgenomates group bacterium]|nr:hypothetical protein [Microgenomates group bacterium]
SDLGYVPPREDFAYFLNLANSAAQETGGGAGAQIGQDGRKFTSSKHLNDLIGFNREEGCMQMQESDADSESWVCYIDTEDASLVIDAGGTYGGPWVLREQAGKFQKLTVFVKGDVIIRNSSGYSSDAAAIAVDVGNFLSLVVLGNMDIEPNVGLAMPNPYSGATLSSQTGQCWEGHSATVAGYSRPSNVATQNSAAGVTEGIFIVDGNLDIKSRESGVNCAAETDKRYIHQGSMVVWGHAEMKRDFSNRERGCVDDAFGIYNNRVPAETFIYRPDLVVNIPSWMRRNTVYMYQE